MIELAAVPGTDLTSLRIEFRSAPGTSESLVLRKKEGEQLQERYQGRSLDRLEDLRFLTGHGKYVANDRVPGVLHAHVVRSPVAFARIARLDLAAARAVPGVVAV